MTTHCQCKSCEHGVVHASDCSVHNMPHAPNGPCDCGAVDALRADRDRLAGEVERLETEAEEQLGKVIDKAAELGTAWERTAKAEAEVARLTALIPTQSDKDIDAAMRDHLWELKQEVIRLNDENNAWREQWEALEDYVQREQPYNDAQTDEFERGAQTMAQIVLTRIEAQR